MTQPLNSGPSTNLSREVERRRTFAIISHPDAGKTTLTEKLLLYSGAVGLAGAVRTGKNRRHAASDWMEIERERGISISSAVLQFTYEDCCFNLLDTPGHQDFSEDTYRTLIAVDSAVMVLDAARGIEPQTRKLFDVCRARRIPILTFINKLDHASKEPLELLDEIERTLHIQVAAMNWPVGNGPTFQGVCDLVHDQILRFERTEHGARKAPVTVSGMDDPVLPALLGSDAAHRLREDVELLGIAGTPFDREQFLSGDLTPVYFGSALNNFGVEPFLQALMELAPPPGPRLADDNRRIPPDQENFSGFIFKIQANMNPKHRDSVAFLHVRSGKFEKDMTVHHPRLNRTVRLTRPYQIFGQTRSTVEEAVAGDVVGLSNPGLFAIGDTLYSGGAVRYEAAPQFQPEHFAELRNVDTSKYKQFHKGMDQLEREGAVQRFFAMGSSHNHPILGAVGKLQFDVVQARLRREYSVETSIDSLPFTEARRIVCDPEALPGIIWPPNSMCVQDRSGRPVALFTSDWQARRCAERNRDVQFHEFGFIPSPAD